MTYNPHDWVPPRADADFLHSIVHGEHTLLGLAQRSLSSCDLTTWPEKAVLELEELRPRVLQHLLYCFHRFFPPVLEFHGTSWSSLFFKPGETEETNKVGFQNALDNGIQHWKGEHGKCPKKKVCAKKIARLTTQQVEVIIEDLFGKLCHELGNKSLW